jgi:Ca2+-binding EF-hand superfamily protein
MDKDGNGTVDLIEFKQCFPDLAEEDVERYFAAADEDHDGALTRQEYTAWVKISEIFF